jgi:hypothetical protein
MRPQMPPGISVGDYTRVRQALAKLDRAREQQTRGTAPDGPAARKGPRPSRTITDPGARLVPVRGGGFIEGCNAQNMLVAKTS